MDSLRKELENAFHVLAVQREITFDVEEHEGLPDEVYWDLDRINEVLGNLLSNAFKFTPHGGSVMLTLAPSEGGVRMEVRDTGAGIPAEQLPHIFEKFYQADNQGSARAAGSGLGLAIAKQIVDAHGGTISCESKPGVGTCFTITLPIHATRRAAVQRELAAIARVTAFHRFRALALAVAVPAASACVSVHAPSFMEPAPRREWPAHVVRRAGARQRRQLRRGR